jgi:hypothetical protein
MTIAPQVAMRRESQIWQVFFPSQTLHVFFFSFAKPSNFLFGPSQKGTICSSVLYPTFAHLFHFIDLGLSNTPNVQ